MRKPFCHFFHYKVLAEKTGDFRIWNHDGILTEFTQRKYQILAKDAIDFARTLDETRRIKFDELDNDSKLTATAFSVEIAMTLLVGIDQIAFFVNDGKRNYGKKRLPTLPLEFLELGNEFPNFLSRFKQRILPTLGQEFYSKITEEFEIMRGMILYLPGCEKVEENLEKVGGSPWIRGFLGCLGRQNPSAQNLCLRP